MADVIIKSKIKQNILKLLFYSNESKEFYLSEIAKIVKTSRGTAQRELEDLKKVGIVGSEKKANLRYYFLNKQDPLFEEWQGIVKKTIGIEKEFEEIIKKIGGIKFAFIFGSYIKGDFKSDSDIDLFIIGNPNEDKLIEYINKLEKKIDREINYHIYGASEFRNKIREDSFLKNITKNYILLTSNQDEFKRLLGKIN